MGGLVVPDGVRGPAVRRSTVLFGELDGTFPNHPADPIQPENLKRPAGARCSTLGADVGLAFDGDADRVFLVDDHGQPAVGLDHHRDRRQRRSSSKQPGATIVHNLICSKAVPEVIREHGGTPVRTRVGHSFIKQVMAETGAVFGGEHSAHYYFRDNCRADSGLDRRAGRARAAVAARACRCPSCASRSSATRDVGRDQHRVSTTRSRSSSGSPRRYADATQDRLDGLTVDFGDWWFNLRPSNTEPLLRLNLEAADARRVRRARRRGARAHHGRLTQLPAMALDPQLLEILACPEDKGPLLYFEDEDALYNPRLQAPLRGPATTSRSC